MERMTPPPGERHDDITNEINLLGAIIETAARERFMPHHAARRPEQKKDKWNPNWFQLTDREKHESRLRAIRWWMYECEPITDDEWEVFVQSTRHAKDATYRQQSKAERKRLGVDA